MIRYSLALVCKFILCLAFNLKIDCSRKAQKRNMSYRELTLSISAAVYKANNNRLTAADWKTHEIIHSFLSLSLHPLFHLLCVCLIKNSRQSYTIYGECLLLVGKQWAGALGTCPWWMSACEEHVGLLFLKAMSLFMKKMIHMQTVRTLLWRTNAFLETFIILSPRIIHLSLLASLTTNLFPVFMEAFNTFSNSR